jgi:hypothetical protein
MNSPIDLALIAQEMGQGQAAGGAGAGKAAAAADVQAFQEKMAQASQKVEAGQQQAEFTLRLPPASSWMESAAVKMDRGGALSNTFDKYTKMSERYQNFQDELMNFGKDLDFNDPATAVHVVEHQAKINASMLEFQFVVQTADNLKHAVTTLFRNQS